MKHPILDVTAVIALLLELAVTATPLLVATK
jgi:hypothetical protein